MPKQYGGWTYMLASGPHGTLYVGVTNDIHHRYWQHTNEGGSAFCKKYGVGRLVWLQHFPDITAAIHREKRIKKWPRRWKINLIEERNPLWEDLSGKLSEETEWIPKGLVDLATLKGFQSRTEHSTEFSDATTRTSLFVLSSSHGRPKVDPGDPSEA